MAEELRDEEFMDEDESFPEVDALIEFLKELPHDTTFILNPKRVEQMEFSYKMLLKSIRDIGKDVTITYGVSEFDKTMASIKLEGKDISVLDIERFSRAAEFADDTDIYPLSADKIRMTLTFHKIYVSGS